MTVTLPSPADFAGVVEGLCGRKVTAEPGAGPHGPQLLVAPYALDDGRPAAVCLFDVAFAAAAGAALALIPAEAASAAVAAGALDEVLRDNLSEILNVAARAFNGDDTGHVRFAGLWTAVSVPGPVGRILAEPGGRTDLAVTIEGYGTGRASLLVA